VIDIRKLAPLAGLVIPTEVRRKEDLVAFLSAKLPGLLPQLAKTLPPDELLECEILAAAGGFMLKWEVTTRLKIEKRKRKEQQGLTDSRKKKKERKHYRDEDDREEDDEDYYYGYHRPTVLDLFVFHRQLESVSSKEEAESGVYLIMPREARQQCFSYVQRSILDFKLSPLVSGVSEVDELFLESPELFDVVSSLLDAIAEKSPKPTPKENLLPKGIVQPVFEERVAKTGFYKTNDDAQLFGWNDFDETLMDFLYSSKLVKAGGKGLEVNSIKAQEILSSGRRGMAESFLKWWGSRKDNQRTIIKPKFYEFEVKPRGLKSDEVRTREILLNVITSELEAGRIYSRTGLNDRCRLSDGGARLFQNSYGNVWSPNGVIDDLFSEFVSMMVIYPLCFLGILEISNDSRLVRLGRWAASSFASSKSSAPTGIPLRAITVTPNFEIIVQPEAKTACFQLREFCEKIDSPGPATLFKITRKKFLEALRRGDYTAEKIISLFYEKTGDKVPENVSHELKNWGERYGEVEIRNMDVVKCMDEATAEILLNDREARKYILGRIGERTLELKQGSKTKMLSRCDQIGVFARG
jgi:hypothetical protein